MQRNISNNYYFLSITLYVQYDKETIDPLEALLHKPTLSDNEIFTVCDDLLDINSIAGEGTEINAELGISELEKIY